MRTKQKRLMAFCSFLVLFWRVLSMVEHLSNFRTYFATTTMMQTTATTTTTTTTVRNTSLHSISSISIQSLTGSSNDISNSSNNSRSNNNNTPVSYNTTFGIFDNAVTGIAILATTCNSTLSVGPIRVSNYTSHTNLDKFVNSVKIWPLPLSTNNNTAISHHNTYNGYNNNNSSSSKEHQAICLFAWNGSMKWESMFHFPHTMQTLYRCWSWWQSNYPTKRPILWLLNNETQERLMGAKASEFNHGFMASLEEFANITIQVQEPFSVKPPPLSPLTGDNSNNVTIHGIDGRPYYVARPFGPRRSFQDSPTYLGETPDHFHALRDVILSGLGARISSNKETPAFSFPRIAILNRKGSRELLNAPEVAHAVESRLSLLWNKNVLPKIQIEEFEGRSFKEQVQFMSTVDVLISPHGAQLTSIPFLPNCASLFEILPKGYGFHHFFGTLAATCGVEHSYVHLTEGGNITITSEISQAMKKLKTRNKSRNAQLCPSISDLVEMIVSVVERWRERCNNKSTMEYSSLI